MEERDLEIRRQEESKKQLVLKLCNVQKSNEKTEKEYQDLKKNYDKALGMIREFVNRQSRLEEKQKIKENEVKELQQELKKSSESSRKKSVHVTARRNLEFDHEDSDPTSQVRYK